MLKTKYRIYQVFDEDLECEISEIKDTGLHPDFFCNARVGYEVLNPMNPINDKFYVCLEHKKLLQDKEIAL